MRTGFLRSAAVAWAVAAAPVRIASPADGEAWEWLGAHTAASDDAKVAPGLSPAQEAVGREALPSVVTLATMPAGARPSENATEGGGFFLAREGVVVTTRRIATLAGPGKVLWARALGSAWAPAVPIGSTWWGDVAVLRVASLRRAFRPVETVPASVGALGRSFTVVGPAVGRRGVVSGATLVSIRWFDPTKPAGTFDTVRNTGKVPAKGSRALALQFAEPLSTLGREGSPILDADGRCVGLVPGPGADPTVATASDLFVPIARRILAAGVWDPPDLGARIGPLPLVGGTVSPVPPEIQQVREKERGGAVVLDVALGGPSQGLLWEGDLVLSVGGVPVFYEVPESFAFATEALVVDTPAEVDVFRGGKRKTLQVSPRPARSVYRDFEGEHAVRAGGRLEAR